MIRGVYSGRADASTQGTRKDPILIFVQFLRFFKLENKIVLIGSTNSGGGDGDSYRVV